MQQSNIKDVLKEIFLINGNNGDLWEKMINILNNKDDQQQAFFKYMKRSITIMINDCRLKIKFIQNKNKKFKEVSLYEKNTRN